jgi:hypothetical protein
MEREFTTCAIFRLVKLQCQHSVNTRKPNALLIHGKQHLRYLHTPDWERDLTKRHEYSLSHMHVIFVNHSPSKTDVRPPNRNERSLTRLAYTPSNMTGP